MEIFLLKYGIISRVDPVADIPDKVLNFLGGCGYVIFTKPEIAEAAVVVHENSGSKQIAAYVVPSNGNMPDSVELRERLSERLPIYMLPAVFVTIEALPRGPNGK